MYTVHPEANMLSIDEREALKRWYAEPRVIERAQELIEEREYQQLEDYLHKTCLLPLSKHDQLPDYLRDTETGKPLFPTNLNPLKDEEKWQDAIDVGWEVIREKLGVGHDDIHRGIATIQEKDWQAFIESVEKRKKERGLR